MRKGELKQFINLSRALGRCPDFIQGTGGNVSVKINNKIFIKASGWQLKDISENNGLVAININNESVENPQNLRPSIETRFHMLLAKYVIHTHSVYTNIVACATNGKKIWDNIFRGSRLAVAWIDYQSPGPHLFSSVKKTVEKFKNQHNIAPAVILAQNHGLIVSGDNLKYVFNLHNKIQRLVKQHLNLKKKFPKDMTGYLKNFIKNSDDLIENFSKNILFPDQIVFCDSIGKKILIDKKTNDIIYQTNQREARIIEENLIAWMYIIDCAKICGLTLNFLSLKDINYIKNMESEKYRLKLIQK